NFFEQFLDAFQVEGQSLRSRLQIAKAALEETEDFDSVREQLEALRDIFLNTEVDPEKSEFLEEAYWDLREQLGEGIESFSLRSNNDIEDLLAAGLYHSVRTRDSSLEALVDGLKEVYASMYTMRAYQIRQAWGLREENLRMPVLVHQYFADEDYSATATIERDHSGHGMLASVNLVLGSDSKATNPRAGSQVLSVKLASQNEEFEIVSDLPQDLDPHVAASVKKILDDLRMELQLSLFHMKVPMDSVELEFAGFPRAYESDDFEIKLFQYKHTYDREIVIDVLDGHIARATLDLESSNDLGDNPGLAQVLDELMVKPLHELNEQVIKAGGDINAPLSVDGHRRYALVEINGKPEIFFWAAGQHVNKLIRFQELVPQGKWLRSGYIGEPDDPEAELMGFTKTSQGRVDPPLDERSPLPRSEDPRGRNYVERAVEEAIRSAVRRDHAFARALRNYERILFQGQQQQWWFDTAALFDSEE
ncbi:MAG: PEP/pyruvate-binding domain-containing protein, partial [Pseudomonadota bacterium]